MEENKFQKYDFGKNCVVVGRVSTSSQSQTAQIEDLTNFAESLGYTHIQPFFTTESGFLEFDNKQGWNLVTDFFESHKDYKVLICPEMSRLSRKENILFKIKDYLKDNKIQLIIKDINYRLFDEYGEIPKGNDIVFALYASLADSEMRQKKERFRRVLADNRRLGYSIGGKELFGYERYYERKDGKERSKYRINEDEAEQIKTIYRWYAFGIDGDLTKTSVLEITKKCIEEGFSHYLHSKRNVNKCLKERAYTGQKETHNRVHNAEYWSYRNTDKPKYVEGKSFICTYPAIFIGEDAALFDKVQERLRENNSKFNDGVPVDKSTEHITVLSKLIKCPECGTFLHGEYRKRTDYRRPNLGARYYFTYRCTYSRGAVKACNFKHILSMPMLDSIVWAYCKKAVLQSISSEERKSTDEQINEIDKKIANIKYRIDDFNIESKIKAEDAILRSKTAYLKSDSAISEAVKEYQNHIESFDKELNGYEKRILELEEEKETIKSNSKFLNSLSVQEDIASNKKLLYKYIHQIVGWIEIVYSDKYYTIIRIHLKKYLLSYRQDEYICIRKRTTREICTMTIHAVNKELIRSVYEDLSKKGYDEHYKRFLINSLPSKDNLKWDKERKEFLIDGMPFTLEYMFAYFTNPYAAFYNLPPEEKVLKIDLSLLPIEVHTLNVERLTCYDCDKK